MTHIILPRGSTRIAQPQGRADIDWKNPLTDNLFSLVLPGIELKDIVSNVSVTTLNPENGTIKTSEQGVAYGSINNSLTPRLYVGDSQSTKGATEALSYTAIVFGRPFPVPATSSVNAIVFSAVPTSSQSVSLLQSNSATYRLSLINSFSAVPREPAAFVLTRNDATGTQRGRIYDKSGFAMTDASRSFVYGGIRILFSGTGGSFEIVNMVAIWERVLTDEEVSSVVSNPWQLFKTNPTNRLYYFPEKTKAERDTGVYLLRSTTVTQASGLVTQQRSDALMVFNGASIMGETGNPVHYQVPDLVTGRLTGIRRSGYENSGMLLNLTEMGQGVRVGNTSGGLTFGSGFDPYKGIITTNELGSQELTAVWHGKFGSLTTGTTYKQIFMRWYDNSSGFRGGWAIRIAPNTSDTIEFAYNSTAGLVTFKFNTPAKENEFFGVVVTVSNGIIKGYVNGNLDFEDVFPITAQTPGTNIRNQPYRLGSDSYTFNALTDVTHLFAGVYGSFFSHDEAVAASQSPWHLLQNHPKQPIQFFTTPSGKVIPYLSGLITTNITSSGARHSLTLTY